MLSFLPVFVIGGGCGLFLVFGAYFGVILFSIFDVKSRSEARAQITP